jgi:hypothetical protein
MLYVLVLIMFWSLRKLWDARHIFQVAGGSRLRPVMVGLGCISLLVYLTMGTIRETARRPDTVRNMITLHDEATHPAADRKGAQSAQR